MRRFLRILAFAFAFVAITYPFVAWFLGWADIIGGSGAEQHAISLSDRPKAYHLLTFGPWQPGAGPCTLSHIHADSWHSLPADAVIVEHRIGTARNFFTRFVYYEAKYKLPDGIVRITHATGPVPLISHRKDTTIAVVVVAALMAAGLMLASSRYPPKSRIRSTTVAQSDAVQTSPS